MKFPCTSCGACCRRVHLYPPFPKDWVREDGACKYLTEDNQCLIYETRPDICRIGHGFNKYNLSEMEYHKLNAMICNRFMEEDGIPEKFIPLSIFVTENYGN
jgi:Fe-S-cluster containining protein